MKNYSPAEEDEIHRLMARLGDDEREKYLLTLEKAFRAWKKGNVSFTELDSLLMRYSQIKVHQVQGDPILTISDALAEGRLDRDQISDELYNRIEIVVRLMKH
ncbi:MAG: hypothetical protein PQJ59_15875 [Spirochaetales bacterium]|nr:hypothetical protein [Spirochaetales bacterium]